MRRFSERDIRRCYDLLQHTPDLGLTQLKALDRGHIIGIGLFNNEKDFVAECSRYNTLGDLYVGVNPRPPDLLDQYGGLKNRVRSLLVDVTASSEIRHITGIAVPGIVPLSLRARSMTRETSLLHDRETFFALPAPLPAEHADELKALLTDDDAWEYDPAQHIRVPGTALPDGGFFNRRAVFRRYRPYQLTELSDALPSVESD